MTLTPEKRLEQYTLKHPEEILLVEVETAVENDYLLIFKGFTSSLMHSTATDPDIPLIPTGSKIINIDRAKSPYLPDAIEYIQKGITWEMMERLLNQHGL